MPQDNVERVRQAYEALSRQDTNSLIGLLDPAVEFRNPEYAMETGTRHGPEEFVKALELGWEVMDDMSYEVERILDQGDVIVVIGRFMARGRVGGVPVESAFGHVLELRDDRVTSVSWFQDPAEALAAAGISAA